MTRNVISSRVAVVRCETYAEAAVYAVVKRGLDLLGGLQNTIRPAEKILLKPNILIGDAPEKLVSPHPFVFKAVGQLVRDISPHVAYGDSPSFGRPRGQALANGVLDAGGVISIGKFKTHQLTRITGAIKNQ